MPEDEITPGEEDFESQVEQATAPLKEEVEALKSQLSKSADSDDDRPAWVRDPNWKPKSWSDAGDEIKKYLRQEGVGEVDVDQLTNQVVEKMQEEEQKKQEEQKRVQQEADKKIEEEVKAVKEQDENVDEKAVFKFAQDWNKENQDSPITSFKVAYELMKAKEGGQDESQDKEHQLFGGPSGGEESSEPTVKKGERPDSVVNRVIQRLQQGG